MPEGPSIIILKEAVQGFKGKKIISVSGNTKIDKKRLLNKKIIDFKSWGKHFLICFEGFTIRIHFMLFGSYRINERRDSSPRLSLRFKKGELNFYTCSIQFIEEPLNDVYDWSGDIMNDEWNARKAKVKLKKVPDMLVCDALLDQHIFAGVGNIIKCEVLFRVRIHPESKIAEIPSKKLNELIKEARNYSFDFLKWKKEFVLRKHWQAYSKKTCPRDNAHIEKKYLGKTGRRTFFCNKCQLLY
ncbi:MAG: endonuclease [Bacteroidetes bacterium]|nr:endonuclease [Bacteroidota bacterium]